MLVAALALMQGCSSDNKKSRTEQALEQTGEAIKADTKDAVDKARADLRQAGSDFERERRKAVADLTVEKDKLDARINKLKADMKRDGRESKADSKRELDKLEAQRTDVNIDIDKARNATADAWQDLKSGFKKVGRNIDNALNKAGDKIDSTRRRH